MSRDDESLPAGWRLFDERRQVELRAELGLELSSSHRLFGLVLTPDLLREAIDGTTGE